MPLSDTKTPSRSNDCEICHGADNGKNSVRNRQIYHILSFEDLDTLRDHLKSVFSDGHYCVEFFTTLWVTAHQLYGQRARDLSAPLWLVYLEAHGVEVKNRGEAIMKFRGRHQQQCSTD